MSAASSSESTGPTFRELDLAPAVLAAIESVGYETPSPIQAKTIPLLLEGRDVIGQAQTGTGKTAAFALPLLSRLDFGQRLPQVLVLAPTRELAIQVAEAFQTYAASMPGFHVLPIYGGQAYGPQLAALRRGVHVVVGTPGRVLDHMKRGTLDLSGIRCLVLDEADEMLKMGFIEDIEAILQQTPVTRQVALFSATMPPQIRRIAQTYLKSPAEVQIAAKTTTAVNIRQRYWMVAGISKLDALTRILEVEDFDGLLIFVRTKAETLELANKLEARGFTATALNGDMDQKSRERTVAKLKSGEIDIVVATDIAARGLDVERIGHVINYDIPTDPESYVHRIGRTGRAGRSGEAILFVAQRERHLLRLIERTTRQPVTPMELPSISAVNDQRVSRFKQKIGEALASDGLAAFRTMVDSYASENEVEPAQIAAALAKLLQGDTPLLLAPDSAARTPPPAAPSRSYTATLPPRSSSPAARPVETPREAGNPFGSSEPRRERPAAQERTTAPRTERPQRADFAAASPVAAPRPERARREKSDEKMETYRIEVGHEHNVKPGNIVGAIANEAGLDSEHIGRVQIFDDHSLVDLPEGMPKKIFHDLKKVWVCGRQLQISHSEGGAPGAAPRGPRKPGPQGGPPRRDFSGKPGPKPHRKTDRR